LHAFFHEIPSGDVASLFSKLSHECISTWFEISYWFTSTFGHLDNPYEHLKRFNQLHMKDNEFFLYLTLGLSIHTIQLLLPFSLTNLASLLHYYEFIPPLYRWRLEEKNVQSLELVLSTFLDFEEKIHRTCYSFGIHDSHKGFSSLIPFINSLQDRMFFLESQYLNHVGSMSWDPSLLISNYNESTNCGQEFRCGEDHDYIMMLNDQSTSHIPNIILLKPHKKTQPQDHLSFQASYLHLYDGEIDYAVEDINYEYVKPMYDTFLFVDDVIHSSRQDDEYSYEFHDTCDWSASEDFHEFNRDLKLYDIIVNPLFQLREVR
jgi:hypothetical protein